MLSATAIFGWRKFSSLRKSQHGFSAVTFPAKINLTPENQALSTDSPVVKSGLALPLLNAAQSRPVRHQPGAV